MAAPESIRKLVDKFEANRESYRLPRYNETQARQEFIDPLFTALGWDISNEQGVAEAYRDVILEDSLEVEGETKAPDYVFRIGKERKFLVEAKKPFVKLETDIHPAFQLRRYAWSAKLPLSVLTDFEEFAVYDCRIPPDKKDKASHGRVALYAYGDYLDKWDDIAVVFSKEAVLRGSFDKYAESVRLKRGTATVDKAFLAEIEGWRELLAKNIALRNPSLSVRELNYAVQVTIDRIIFLRICEAREIEPYGQLAQALEHESIYKELGRLFQVADARYNSGLFHFKEEKGQPSQADGLTLGVEIDNKVLQPILKNLYWPESPYVFSVIPLDILGQVYEQFLGKVIRLTAGHQAKVEEKPEVRKSGGVYYTPTYIVDYIVKNTVGKLLEGKTPAQAAKLKIVDPACGSGTFLLGAYQTLLDWHMKWYSENDPQKWAMGRRPAIFQSKNGWMLTTAKKKEILLNNIHGVDIDSQAVEVTKLSLLLKVLEGENLETIGSQLALLKERVLPDLGNNIKCGNSLIGPDYFDGRLQVDEEKRQRVNAFDWKAEFPQVFAQGGFDVVIGNPPYVRIQTLQETSEIDVEFYKKRYTAAGKGNYDIYVVFVEKGLDLLDEKGRLGFILPHKFFNAKYGEPLRGFIAAGRHLAKVVHFGDQQVFGGATTYTCLLFLGKAGCAEFEFERVADLDAWRAATPESKRSAGEKLSASHATAGTWDFSFGEAAALIERLDAMPVRLGDVAARMAQGIRTSANEVYVVDLISSGHGIATVFSEQLKDTVYLERKALSPFLQGRDIKRYAIRPSGKMVIIPYRLENAKVVLNSPQFMQHEFPRTLTYLQHNKDVLERRENGRMRGTNWYAYVYPKNIELMKQPKILVPDISNRAQFALDDNGEYALASGYAITLKPDSRLTPKYVLGLLNSRLLEFCLKRVSTPMQNGFFRFFTQFLGRLPINPIDSSSPGDEERHDRMVSLVERMLALHKQSPKTPQEKDALQRDIVATDAQIDRLVYELYGLTEEEIKVVEGEDRPAPVSLSETV